MQDQEGQHCRKLSNLDQPDPLGRCTEHPGGSSLVLHLFERGAGKGSVESKSGGNAAEKVGSLGVEVVDKARQVIPVIHFLKLGSWARKA